MPDRSQVWHLGRDLSTHLHVHLAEFLAAPNLGRAGICGSRSRTWRLHWHPTWRCDGTYASAAVGTTFICGFHIGSSSARSLSNQSMLQNGQDFTPLQCRCTGTARRSVRCHLSTICLTGLHTLLPDAVMSLAALATNPLPTGTSPVSVSFRQSGGLGDVCL